jgi:DNA-binding MarR family transcriptional regulator
MRKPPAHPSLARAATVSRPAPPHAAARERYLAAWRWRRSAEAELRPLGLTFAQWLVLEATQDLEREQRDAVSQVAVAQRVELDRATTSQIMTALSELGMVDRGPSMSGPAYRIIVTQKGRRCLRDASKRLSAQR